MNIELVLQQLDSLFADHKVYQVEDFLKGKIEEAAGEGDRNAVITLMNEIIGHFRETGEFDKSIEYCEPYSSRRASASLNAKSLSILGSKTSPES